jgi:CRP-like cAMP-binding protein
MAKRPASIALLKYAENVASYKAGEVVFQAGDSGKHMYVVKSGAVELRIGGQRVESLKSGDVFGEMALVDGEQRCATAIAITDAQLVPIDQPRFEYLVKQTPYFALEVMQIMARRLRQMNVRRP